jgi:hypothetical protein
MNSVAANPMTLLEELRAILLAKTGRGIEAVSYEAHGLVPMPPQTEFAQSAAVTTQDSKPDSDVPLQHSSPPKFT